MRSVITIEKTPGRDFAILNLSDPQPHDGERENGHKTGHVLTGTVRQPVERAAPDLVTVTGNVARAHSEKAAGAERRYRDPGG